ncbi:MAG: 2-C-methyl-D-erythritol 4-phosphate cytidylyltransferase [Thermodesulfobacteriota bacterium]
MTRKPICAAVIPAGGIGRRSGMAAPKQFCLLAGVPLLVHTLRVFEAAPSVSLVVVAAPAEHLARTEALIREYGLAKVRRVVVGGASRQESVAAGLAALPEDIELVAVHDGARPLISVGLIEACLDRAATAGAAIAAVAVKDTLKRVEDGELITATVERAGLWQAQTPQAARVELLRQAMTKAAREGFIGTDEAQILERAGVPVQVVAGDERNIKVTRPEDFRMAEALLQTASPGLRIGHGFDAHRFAPGRRLVLGGVVVPHELGLLGHSDADVLTHAVCDAILGALGAGDLGRHFPDSDERYRGISSLLLLEQVIAGATDKGWAVANLDVTVIAQRPKLSPHVPAMIDRLAAVCGVAAEQINIKGTTTERMGFTGREEGIAAHAVVLLRSVPRS